MAATTQKKWSDSVPLIDAKEQLLSDLAAENADLKVKLDAANARAAALKDEKTTLIRDFLELDRAYDKLAGTIAAKNKSSNTVVAPVAGDGAAPAHVAVAAAAPATGAAAATTVAKHDVTFKPTVLAKEFCDCYNTKQLSAHNTHIENENAKLKATIFALEDQIVKLLGDNSDDDSMFCDDVQTAYSKLHEKKDDEDDYNESGFITKTCVECKEDNEIPMALYKIWNRADYMCKNCISKARSSTFKK